MDEKEAKKILRKRAKDEHKAQLEAEKFIADEKEKGGVDKAPYIEEHELN